MKLKLLMLMFAATLLSTEGKSQTKLPDPEYRKFFIGSTLFVLSNLAPDNNPPEFAQLNFGYRVTPKEIVSVEFKTWRYAWPLGIPYGDSFEASGEGYPGSIRDFGTALVYQRFVWKGLYGAVHALNAVEKYSDMDGKKITNGYMLFMTYRVGYHIELFRNRMFIEPSVAMTQWPIRTNTPEAFAAVDSRWPKYFLFEPGLHFGVKF